MTEMDQTTHSSTELNDAMTEVSFLLDILATTVDDLMGGATVSVGRVAGRHQARRLPIHVDKPTVANVVVALNQLDKLGTQFSLDADNESLVFAHCAIRAVCQGRNLELGGRLCHLYHCYLDGIINEFLLRPTRSHLTSVGMTCRYRLEVR